VRHRRARTKLGRTSSHRKAMYENMVTALVEHGRVTTTERKAKELRGIAEKVVTRATSLGDLLLKDLSKLEADDKARVVHAIRMLRKTVKNRETVLHLLKEVAPRFLGRPGGYTRINKVGFRKGDGAPVAILEFVEAEMPEREGGKPEEPEKKGRFSWLRGKGKGKGAEKPAKESPSKQA
jgi:large subunit ribosomal protein L17